MKKITTSAQKSIVMDKKLAVARLVDNVSADAHVEFTQTCDPFIYKAKLAGDSKLTVAVFDKENGKILAMIDHKNIPEDKRKSQQNHWKELLENTFK